MAAYADDGFALREYQDGLREGGGKEGGGEGGGGFSFRRIMTSNPHHFTTSHTHHHTP